MSKRSADSQIEYYTAKIKKLQSQKCVNNRRRLIVYSSSSDSEENSDNGAHSKDESNQEQPPASSPAPPPVPPDISSDDVINNVDPTPELDPELLQALGDTPDDTPVYGPNIHSNLAQRWLPILTKGIKQETKEKLLKEYAIPDNCKLLKAPTLNAEISAAVSDITRSRDKKMQASQNQLGLGITAINRAMTLLLTGDDKVQVIKILSDSCRILTDLHFMESQVRTKLITPGLDKSFLTVIQDQDRDETLFGSKLPEKIKASKAIVKQGLQIKKGPILKASAPSTSSSNSRPRQQGNWSGPPRYPSSNRGGRAASYRAMQAPAPAPQPYRRAPFQTPPPQRPSPSTTNKRAPTRH